MASETLRLFVAIELPDATRRTLGELGAALRRDVQASVGWARTDAMHLTLRFLGETDSSLVPALGEAIAGAVGAVAPFPLKPSGAGVFPSGRDPRVIWAGLDGDASALASLRDAVEDAVERCGLARDARPFRAHLTLGRIRQRLRRPEAERLLERLAAVDLRGSQPFEVREVVLFSSELRQEGARHTALARASLSA